MVRDGRATGPLPSRCTRTPSAWGLLRENAAAGGRLIDTTDENTPFAIADQPLQHPLELQLFLLLAFAGPVPERLPEPGIIADLVDRR